MNTKNITLTFISITLSLALLQFSLAPLAIAGPPHEQISLPAVIAGEVIPSQSNLNSNEPTYEGAFGILLFDLGNGQFMGAIQYKFFNDDGFVSNGNAPIEIYGTYKSAKNGLMIQFSGDGVSGQLKQDPRYTEPEGLVIGFINTPGNGYLSQVFVGGLMFDEIPE